MPDLEPHARLLYTLTYTLASSLTEFFSFTHVILCPLLGARTSRQCKCYGLKNSLLT